MPGTAEPDSMDAVVRCQGTCVRPCAHIHLMDRTARQAYTDAVQTALVSIRQRTGSLRLLHWHSSQMATFMQDLESSGLLADDGAAAASDAHPDTARTPAASQPAAATATDALHVSRTSEVGPAPSVRPAHVAADADQAVSGRDEMARLRGSRAGTSAEQLGPAPASGDDDDGVGTDISAGGDGEGEQAEQRVLGNLQGVDGWFEVMDMASRQVCHSGSAHAFPAADPCQCGQ